MMYAILLILLNIWPSNGVLVYNPFDYDETSSELIAYIAPDSANGVYYTWSDNRSGTYNVYAQHIDSAGILLWHPEGIIISNAPKHQFLLKSIPDGVGGIITAWVDSRTGTDYDLFGQRINEQGTLLWGLGTPISAVSGSQYACDIVTNHHQGFIAVWEDSRNATRDIYMQHIDSTGAPNWNPAGIPLCLSNGSQHRPTCININDTHYIAVWEDLRDGNYDIYGQLFDLAGNVYWSTNGLQLIGLGGHQFEPEIISSNDSFFLMIWQDSRNVPTNTDLYMQLFDLHGNQQWTAGGVQIAGGRETQRDGYIIMNELNQFFIGYHDTPTMDVRCCLVDTSGTILWNIPTSTGSWLYHQPRMVRNDSNGVIIQWSGANNENIFAQSYDNSHNAHWFPLEGIPVCLLDNNEPFNIATDRHSGFYTSFRVTDTLVYDFDIHLQRIYHDGTPGITNHYATVLSPLVIYPNPVKNCIFIDHGNSSIYLKLYDVSGRRVAEYTSQNGSCRWNIKDPADLKLAAGVYFLEVQSDNNTAEVHKIVIVK